MNRKPEQEELLAEVMTEAAPDQFRDALLAETLRLARHRRRIRRAWRVGGTLGAVVVLGAIALLSFGPRSSHYPVTHANYQLVRTAPLLAARIVHTHPLPAAQIVTSHSTAAIVSTSHSHGTIRELTDDELLALVPQPAALIRRGPHEMELIMVKPDGAGGVRVN